MLNDHTFLYVEDDPLGREAIFIVLTRVMQLQRVYLFEDSTDFINRLKTLEYRPDVILLDIHMEPLDGFAVLKLLRNEPTYCEATVIALTASVMNEEVELLKRSGFDGAIGKPVNINTFPGLMERAVQGEPVWHITD